MPPGRTDVSAASAAAKPPGSIARRFAPGAWRGRTGPAAPTSVRSWRPESRSPPRFPATPAHPAATCRRLAAPRLLRCSATSRRRNCRALSVNPTAGVSRPLRQWRGRSGTSSSICMSLHGIAAAQRCAAPQRGHRCCVTGTGRSRWWLRRWCEQVKTVAECHAAGIAVHRGGVRPHLGMGLRWWRSPACFCPNQLVSTGVINKVGWYDRRRGLRVAKAAPLRPPSRIAAFGPPSPWCPPARSRPTGPW